VNPGYRGQVTGDRWEVEGRRWEGSGKVRCRKEKFFSLHLACAIFPAVTFKVHGKKAGFRGAKVQIFSILFFLFRSFLPYLLDGGLHLLAVDVDGSPAGAVLCHKPVVYGRDVSRINQIMRHD
jgi:hypothetical protein